MESGMVLGAETEYTISTVPDARTDHECLLRFVRQARHTLRNLPQDDGDTCGIFIANGGRLYPDCGHLEYASPETLNPRDLVLYQQAGERIMQDLARRVEESYIAPPCEVVVTHAAVDYSSGVTQGSHENYSFSKTHLEEPAELLPFLASRVIYAGAGGFNNLTPGLEFVVSPRALHIQTSESTSSTDDRPLYHVRRESLAGGEQMSRIHLINGEHLCTATSSLLRFGTTALVIKMIECGITPGAAVPLPLPVDALHRFATDPTCTETVPVANRAPMTAIAIQRHYLAIAEESLHRPWAPVWAPEICGLWRRTLDQLETDPDGAATWLDWRMKHTLYTRYLNRNGFDWDSVGQISKAVAYPGTDMPAHSRLRDRIQYLTARSRTYARCGIAPEEFERFLVVRQKLFELDTRFAQVGPRGVFTQLRDANVVQEQYDAPTPAQIKAAVDQPPKGCRSQIRGQVIGERHHHRQNYRCDWTHIINVNGPRFLNLSDPFQTHAAWTAEE